eukprot:gene3149-3618_t
MSKDGKRLSSIQSTKIKEKEARELQRLLSLLNTPSNKQQLPALSEPAEEKSVSSSPKTKDILAAYYTKEAAALKNFCARFQSERDFTKSIHATHFHQIFDKIVKQRLCSLEWNCRAPQANLFRLLTCLRIFLRDQNYQVRFIELQGIKHFTERLKAIVESYLEYGEKEYTIDILKEMTNISQKLVAAPSHREWIVACGLHTVLILLLSCIDVTVLHSVLYALIGLSQSDRTRCVIGESNCIDALVRIIQDYDIVSKQLAINLLRSLCADVNIREQVKVFDGIPVWILVQLAADQDTRNEIRLLGGIPLLLSLLQDRDFVSADLARTPVIPTTEDASLEQRLSLKSAVCAAITELVLNDANAHHIVTANGVYLLGMMIFPIQTTTAEDSAAAENLQKSAFRALRLLPPKLFETFIDTGHYKKDLDAYSALAEDFNHLQESERDEIKERFEDSNQNKAATSFIKHYAVYEHLGTGAFGSVYKVKKTGGQSFLALKEISILNPAFGKTKSERESSIGDILNECIFVREQACQTLSHLSHLRHPNVVRYHKAFKEDDKLYIIMELIDGAPLGEHFNSLKEKGERFSEERLWNILIQIVLGLHYIHKEKRIIHRDLTPNNIMLGENDKVTITDFGLARQKQPDTSKMTSVVGTILYSCPEIIQNLPYGEKADVWALGCVLYQMATLKPPFFSSNMLTLATKIVAADYDPLPDDSYSRKVVEVIRNCLTSDPEKRPDINGVAAIISDVLLDVVDRLKQQVTSLEKKLEKERRRTQRHYFEAHQSQQKYHRLFIASQQLNDRLSSVATSNGSRSMSLSTTKLDSDFENDEFEEKYQKMFSIEPTLQSPGINANMFASDILGSSEQDAAVVKGTTMPPADGLKSPLNKFGSLERNTKLGARARQQLDDVNTRGDEAGEKEDVFVKPRPPAGRRGARRPLPLDYATQTSKTSHDDRVSATKNDDLPDVKRTQSCSSIESYQRMTSGGKIWRPNSATVTISISPRKVRQINDPIQEMLSQMHKIVFLTQLPPPLAPNPQRRVIEQFKRSLFSPNSNSAALKDEMKKLLEGSKELIDVDLGPGWKEILLKTSSGLDASSDASEVISETGITYEHLQSLIEGMLLENGYYEIPANNRHIQQPLVSKRNSEVNFALQMNH